MILQKSPPVYSGNAPFPLAFGIPNAEPLSYDLSSYSSGLISITPEAEDSSITSKKVSYYHPKPKKDLEFTVNNPRITLKQRLFYEENGFLVIPNLVPEDLLDHCQQRFLDLVDGKVNKGIIKLLSTNEFDKLYLAESSKSFKNSSPISFLFAWRGEKYQKNVRC